MLFSTYIRVIDLLIVNRVFKANIIPKRVVCRVIHSHSSKGMGAILSGMNDLAYWSLIFEKSFCWQVWPDGIKLFIFWKVFVRNQTWAVIEHIKWWKHNSLKNQVERFFIDSSLIQVRVGVCSIAEELLPVCLPISLLCMPFTILTKHCHQPIRQGIWRKEKRFHRFAS